MHRPTASNPRNVTQTSDRCSHCARRTPVIGSRFAARPSSDPEEEPVAAVCVPAGDMCPSRLLGLDVLLLVRADVAITAAFALVILHGLVGAQVDAFEPAG